MVGWLVGWGSLWGCLGKPLRRLGEAFEETWGSLRDSKMECWGDHAGACDKTRPETSPAPINLPKPKGKAAALGHASRAQGTVADWLASFKRGNGGSSQGEILSNGRGRKPCERCAEICLEHMILGLKGLFYLLVHSSAQYITSFRGLGVGVGLRTAPGW